MKELYFPKDNFVLRFIKEDDEWVLRLDEETLELFQSMLNGAKDA